MRDPEYLDASRRFFAPMSALLGAPLVDARDAFTLAPYMVSDAVHLNSIGSAQFSRLVAARVAGRPDPGSAAFAVDARVLDRLPDPTWTLFTALIARAGDQPSTALRIQFVQSWGVRDLVPGANVRLALRMPDGAESLVPAQVVAPGVVLADTSRLALRPGDSILVGQLVFGGGMGNSIEVPVASYEWLSGKPGLDFGRRTSQAALAVDRGVIGLMAPIPVTWSRVVEPSPKDWIGLFPADPESTERLAVAYTGGSKSGHREFPPLPRVGTYEARLMRRDSWETIAISAPFRVEALSATLEAPERIASGTPLRVRWARLNIPHPKDWIGLFAPRGPAGSFSTIPTGGAPQGDIDLPTTNLKPGEYEVRLYSAGGWTQVAAAPVRILEPAAR
jgi:hypothetical protein